MISLNKKITAIIWARRLNAKDLIGGIRNNKGHQINTGHSTPLINNLKTEFFKDEKIEEGAGITDLINKIVQVLREDLYWVRIST